MGKFTIYDLASDLGLSVSTTSKAINGYTDVSMKTRERVMQRAKELGFEPSMAAKANTTKQSFLLGVIYAEKGEGLMHPHFSEILENFRKTVEMHGYQIMFIGENNLSTNRTLLQTCRYRGVDGVLIMAFDHRVEELHQVLESDIPMVLVDYEWENCSSVISNNEDGMKRIIDYCWQQGHRDFCYIAAPKIFQAAEERLYGIKDGLKKYGIQLPEEKIVYTDEYSFKEGYDAMEKLLKRKLSSTVVVTAYDRYAFGAMYCLQEHGIKVPEELSVTGFDDLPSDQMLFWKLTTVRQQRAQIGIEAGRILLDEIQHGEKEQVRIRLDTPLVVRTSVKKI
ncbi:MAG: LacI family DNA-binding transcriptional regulator [Clostridia bacterium]